MELVFLLTGIGNFILVKIMEKLNSDFQNLPQLESCTIAIIGLGYVGLPLAVEFVKREKCLKSGKNLSLIQNNT